MTDDPKDDREALERLTAAMVEDLLKASEEELTAEILDEGRNPSQEAEAMASFIERAARRCGKLRLQTARDALKSAGKSKPQASTADMGESRRRLAAILAAGGVSMAARNESELSDNDVLGMLADIEELRARSKTKKPDSDL
ncbi:hypothetical protein ACQR1N_30885 [Bradyrhizobium sp. HKCCYLRH1073]|uniref:hypothetical protein n=1 Tax=unclassified Bradyrhizobium TaxID=2631580 RepID=UPI0029162554|nr:hypothetical protein [Bradyrhizobium sp. SZCCHNS3052]